MPIFLLKNWKLIAIAAAAVAVFLAGWTVNGWRWETKVSAMETAWAVAAQKATEDARKREAQLAFALADLDAKYTMERKQADEEMDRLRTAVDVGSVRLRVRATCPDGVPTDSPGPGVGDGTGAILDPGARSDYFTLRAGIMNTERKLAACQGVLRKERE